MLLNSKFDVLRGWPKEGAIDESFGIHQTTPGTDDLLPRGMVVTIGSDGLAIAATTPDRSTVNAVSPWVVVEGNDDYSSQFVRKVVCLRSNAMLQLDPSNFNAGTYTPGVKLTFSAGKWQPVAGAAHNQIIGEVIRDNTATDGTIVVMYTGGGESSFV